MKNRRIKSYYFYQLFCSDKTTRTKSLKRTFSIESTDIETGNIIATLNQVDT